MLVFKSKIISSGVSTRRPQDDAASVGSDSVRLQKAALSSLSKQEKLLLLELQRTRKNIVEELTRLDPSISTDGWSDVQKTISDYQSKISRVAAEETIDGRNGRVVNLSASSSSSSSLSPSRHMPTASSPSSSHHHYHSVSTTKRNAAILVAANIPISRIRTGIDMLPVLANTGESALEVGLRKQGELKLPVFKLPAIDASRLAGLSLEEAQATEAGMFQTVSPKGGDASNKARRNQPGSGAMSLSLRSEPAFRRTRCGLLEYVALLLSESREMPPLDLAFLKRHLYLADRDYHDVQDELERRVMLRTNKDTETTGDITIFLKVQGGGGDHLHGQQFSVVPNLPRGESSLDNMSVDSLTWGGSVSVASVGSRGGHSIRSSMSNKKKLKASPSALLKTELMQSLRSMQHHTERVKDGIAAMQAVVATGNPRAKAMLAAVAAERLSDALYRIVVKELRRGWLSWILAVKQIRRIASTERIVRFLGMRKFSRVLGDTAHRCLSRRLIRWVNFTQRETARIFRLRRVAAACVMQRYLRGCMARDRVNNLRDSRKFKELYAAVVKIQAQIKGRLVRWRYTAFCRKRKEDRAIRKLQRVQRGHRARRRVLFLRRQRNRVRAACLIQALARGRRDRLRVRSIVDDRKRWLAARKIQKIARGRFARTRIKQILHKIKLDRAVRKVQAIWRGAICRMSIGRKKRELREYKETRYKAARDIQRVIRGFRSRMTTRMKQIEAERKRRKFDNAATKIITMCRGHAARALVRQMRKDRNKQMLEDARSWVETWSDDADAFYYFNAGTGETLWEPPATGYTKVDGTLILASGEVIADPEVEEADEQERKRQLGSICSECTDRVAIKLCNECGDNFCTPCFRTCHTAGARRLHTHTALGPLDCSECEMLLAERWCVSCDEAFCDGCWRKVHARGKRRFHPFSDVSARGKIDSRIFTMDGSEVQQYNAAYAQDQWEGAAEAEHLADASEYVAAAAARDAEWSEYTDDNCNTYYYNSATGESTYDYPW